jgi:hypothetical protein
MALAGGSRCSSRTPASRVFSVFASIDGERFTQANGKRLTPPHDGRMALAIGDS